MANPWEEISLSDYENHMSLSSVMQLQAMNHLMKSQFEAYPVKTAMVLGIAGGNGLEHVNTSKYSMVYGIDINTDYLKAVAERYADLGDLLQCIHLNLIEEYDKLPHAELLIANLLIEYIGYDVFVMAVSQVKPAYVCCVIQINTDKDSWVSDSPYLHGFDRLDEVHHQMEPDALCTAMSGIGYRRIMESETPLPNGKSLMRIDFQR